MEFVAVLVICWRCCVSDRLKQLWWRRRRKYCLGGDVCVCLLLVVSIRTMWPGDMVVVKKTPKFQFKRPNQKHYSKFSGGFISIALEVILGITVGIRT